VSGGEECASLCVERVEGALFGGEEENGDTPMGNASGIFVLIYKGVQRNSRLCTGGGVGAASGEEKAIWLIRGRRLLFLLYGPGMGEQEDVVEADYLRKAAGLVFRK